ncbi:hypothetical protein L1887_36096 [Cichorium endivia]|nr:hypothetical protein L1887_36096 [Cichorium endivia]
MGHHVGNIGRTAINNGPNQSKKRNLQFKATIIANIYVPQSSTQFYESNPNHLLGPTLNSGYHRKFNFTTVPQAIAIGRSFASPRFLKLLGFISSVLGYLPELHHLNLRNNNFMSSIIFGTILYLGLSQMKIRDLNLVTSTGAAAAVVGYLSMSVKDRYMCSR